MPPQLANRSRALQQNRQRHDRFERGARRPAHLLEQHVEKETEQLFVVLNTFPLSLLHESEKHVHTGQGHAKRADLGLAPADGPEHVARPLVDGNVGRVQTEVVDDHRPVALKEHVQVPLRPPYHAVVSLRQQDEHPVQHGRVLVEQSRAGRRQVDRLVLPS